MGPRDARPTAIADNRPNHAPVPLPDRPDLPGTAVLGPFGTDLCAINLTQATHGCDARLPTHSTFRVRRLPGRPQVAEPERSPERPRPRRRRSKGLSPQPQY